jgi:hypothetical protein
MQALWTAAKGLLAVWFVSALLVLPAYAGTAGDDAASTQAQSGQGSSDKMQLSLLGTESHANQGNNTSCEIKECGQIKLHCDINCIGAQAVCSCNCHKRLLGVCTELKESCECR